MSKTDSVRTPPFILKSIRREFGRFFDPVPFNPTFNKTKNRDGLKIPWKKVTFVNPPYSNVKPWVIKAREEWKLGKTVIMLLKLANLATSYGKLLKGAEIRIFAEKLSFPGYEGRAKFNSVLVILRKNRTSSKYKFIENIQVLD
jgi:hypothetical protein